MGAGGRLRVRGQDGVHLCFDMADRGDLLVGLVRGPQAGEGDVMATLPGRPNLEYLRRQAKDLLRAAQAGDTTAVGRIRAVSGRSTLAAAQLAVAREYGFASGARLKDRKSTRLNSSHVEISY